MNYFEKAVIIFCILVAIFCIAMLARGDEIHGYLEIGWIKELEAVETEIQLSYSPFNFLLIYGGFGVIAEPATLFSYKPYRDVYTIGAKLDISKHLWVKGEHVCTHPVWSSNKQFKDKFESGTRTEFAVGVTW